MSEKIRLTKEGREELALALLLLKDFKTQEKGYDPEVTMQIIEMASVLGVGTEFEEILSKVPPMRIQPRYL